MDQPALYTQANVFQRYDAKKLIKEFADVLQFRSDGRDSLMDIGCGPGDILMDFIYPILPKTSAKIIGTDISPLMLQHAKKKYGGYGNVDFKLLDIGTEKLPLDYHEQFDHVTSFFCLHWVQKQRQALKNIYNMLFKDGDCLLVYVSSCPLFDIYQTLAVDPNWCDYMKDADKFLPRLQNNPDTWQIYTKLFKEVGFTYQNIEVRHQAYIYEGYESFTSHLMSVNPFVGRMPIYKRQEHINEICKCFKELGLCEKMEHQDDYRYTFPYKLVVAYAKK